MDTAPGCLAQRLGQPPAVAGCQVGFQCQPTRTSCPFGEPFKHLGGSANLLRYRPGIIPASMQICNVFLAQITCKIIFKIAHLSADEYAIARFRQQSHAIVESRFLCRSKQCNLGLIPDDQRWPVTDPLRNVWPKIQRREQGWFTIKQLCDMPLVRVIRGGSNNTHSPLLGGISRRLLISIMLTT
nr:hypothetical protein [Puniceibacterium sediminis]